MAKTMEMYSKKAVPTVDCSEMLIWLGFEMARLKEMNLE